MDGDGFPLAFDIFPGNQNEQKSLKPLEHKDYSRLDCSEFIYCSDSADWHHRITNCSMI